MALYPFFFSFSLCSGFGFFYSARYWVRPCIYSYYYYSPFLSLSSLFGSADVTGTAYDIPDSDSVLTSNASPDFVASSSSPDRLLPGSLPCRFNITSRSFSGHIFQPCLSYFLFSRQLVLVCCIYPRYCARFYYCLFLCLRVHAGCAACFLGRGVGGVLMERLLFVL